MLAVEHAARGVVVAGIDAFAGDPVVLGLVPAHQRLPHVVVREVAMLVVRRVEVHQVDRAEQLDRADGVPSHGVPGTGEQHGHLELQVGVRARRPLLEVGHLQPRGRVDPVCGQQQRGEQDRPQRTVRVVALDRRADRVDARTVVRLEVARLLAEGAGDVARPSREAVEPGDLRPEGCQVDLVLVGGDVAVAELAAVGGRVGRGDLDAAALELLGDSRRAGEQVDRGSGSHRVGDLPQHRHQEALGAEVLDHSRDRRCRWATT